MERSLRHYNIVNFFGACLVEPRIGLVVEYCEKGSLYRLLHKERLSMPQKLQILLDISRGMSFLHNRNVIHRDLKSANVLVCIQKKVYIHVNFFIPRLTRIMLPRLVTLILPSGKDIISQNM